MNFTQASVLLESITPYSQSRPHEEPKAHDREQPDDYDQRTWLKKLTTDIRDGKEVVVIPAFGLHQAIVSAAKYTKRKIPGQGQSTWTAKFSAGIMFAEDPSLGVTPADVNCVRVYSNADGIRGSGKRVWRRFPVIPQWSALVEITVLDQILTEPVLREMLTIAGMFVGIGRFAPRVGGGNGRFKVAALEWREGDPAPESELSEAA